MSIRVNAVSAKSISPLVDMSTAALKDLCLAKVTAAAPVFVLTTEQSA
jgi:hypothetical protein